MSLFEDDPDAIRRQERQVQEQAERARVMRQRIEAVQGVGTSADERVEVVVDSGGTLLGIGSRMARSGSFVAATPASRSSAPPRPPSARTTRASNACVPCTACLTRRIRTPTRRILGPP